MELLIIIQNGNLIFYYIFKYNLLSKEDKNTLGRKNMYIFF